MHAITTAWLPNTARSSPALQAEQDRAAARIASRRAGWACAELSLDCGGRRRSEAHTGNSLVIAGDRVSRPRARRRRDQRRARQHRSHRLVHSFAPARRGGPNATLASLADALSAGSVDTLVCIGGNPVVRDAGHMDSGPDGTRADCVYVGLYENESARALRGSFPLRTISRAGAMRGVRRHVLDRAAAGAAAVRREVHRRGVRRRSRASCCRSARNVERIREGWRDRDR